MGQPYSDIVGWGSAEWQAALARSDRFFFTLHINAEPVGTTGFKVMQEERYAHLIASYIAPEYRGLGLSRLLYREVIAFIRNHLALDYLTVDHREGNDASGHAILGAGFVPTGTYSERTFGDGTTGKLVNYRLQL